MQIDFATPPLGTPAEFALRLDMAMLKTASSWTWHYYFWPPVGLGTTIFGLQLDLVAKIALQLDLATLKMSFMHRLLLKSRFSWT